MSAPLSPRQDAGRVAVEAAVFALLLHEDDECHRILADAVDQGLIEEVCTGGVGLSAFLVTQIAELTETDPVQAWGEFMRRPL